MAKNKNTTTNSDGSLTLPDGTVVTPAQLQALQNFASPQFAGITPQMAQVGQQYAQGGASEVENPLTPKSSKSTTPSTSSSSTAKTPTPPSYDPLALQQLWSQVLGPIFNQVSGLAKTAGPDYLTAMQQAIAGSNESPQMQGQQLDQAKAMSSLINAISGSNLQQTASGPAFDTLINWLQQATGAAQLAQGSAEKAIAYGTNLNAAQAFGVPSAQSATSSNNLSPQQTAALTQQALGGTQTGTTATGTTNPNTLLPSQLLQQQSIQPPAAQATVP